MPLEKCYIRDGEHRIIGSVTTGFVGAYDTVVKDEHEQIVGSHQRTIRHYRDEHGGLVSTNSSDPGLLIGRKK